MEVYLGVYRSDDMNSKKSCNTQVLFGGPLDKDGEMLNHHGFDWKWVTLPCPHCGVTHNFKRETYFIPLHIEGIF